MSRKLMMVRNDVSKGILFSVALVLLTSCMGLGSQSDAYKPIEPVVASVSAPVQYIAEVLSEQVTATAVPVIPSKTIEKGLRQEDKEELSRAEAPTKDVLILDSTHLGVPDGSRVALIIGNSSYNHMHVLQNPTNDAEDISQLLTQLGFETELLLDGSLSQIEGATRSFVDNSKKEGVATSLFFYAGHAVQYEGSNYLIPVYADIKRDNELLGKAYNMDVLLKGLERSAAELNLIILDACRDNPFSTTRGGARGLSAMGFGTAESMVVFATAPGSVAEDGSGRNSPFTQAMKEHLLTPDLEVRHLIAQVSKSVQEKTKGRQIPWVNTSFTGEFFFLTGAQEVYLRQLELQSLGGELAALESAFDEMQAAIASAQGTEEKNRLGLEQKRIAALTTAKRLEEERIIALRIAAEQHLAAQEKELAAKQQLQSQLTEEEKALQQLAQQRRSELAKLSQQQSQAGGALERLQTVAQFEQTIVDVYENYTETIRLTNVEFGKLKDQQVASYLASKPRAPWEILEEYNARIQTFEAPLKRENAQEIAKIESQRVQEVSQLITQMNVYKKDVSSQDFVIGAGMTSVEVLPFDAAGKYFPIQVTSKQASLPFTATVHYRITGTDYDAISAEYARIEDAANTGALVATMYYFVEEISPFVWKLEVKRIEVHSLLESDQVTAGFLQAFSSASFVKGDTTECRAISEGSVWKPYAIVPIETFPFDASIIVNGTEIGFGKATCYVASADIKNITITARDATGMTSQRSIAIRGGLNQPVTLAIAKVGDIGPAGGYVFYDIGYYYDGWRYLETAPAGWSGASADPSYEFGGSGTTIGGTSTAVGGGKTNTQKIVQKLGSYSGAARIAGNYVVTVDGVVYDDWFLPSIDELNLMHKNLYKKGLGSFSGDCYWSSSEGNNNYSAWNQRFSDGNQGNSNSRSTEKRVRPIRAF